ncbi:MAG: hypothetical protein IJW08_04385 [Lentisphaeria bacterium]|nr:hypothetical protein [Lentisphaeria bacterium]
MLKNIFVPAAALATILLLMTAIMHFTKLQASPALPVSTQSFSPARYAIAAADINVANLQSPGLAKSRKIIVRLDSVTGKLHILQLTIRGDNDPTVLSAVWAPVTEAGTFSPFGASQAPDIMPNQLSE